jgi:hypothetical protein
MASATALFGPWPDSSICRGGVICCLLRCLGSGPPRGVDHHCLHHQESGIVFEVQVPAMGVAKHHEQTSISLPPLGYGGGPGCHHFSPFSLSFEGDPSTVL